MVLLVDCRQLDLRRAKGLENFALAILTGLVAETKALILDVPALSYREYHARFGKLANVTICYDAVQGMFQKLETLPMAGRVVRAVFDRIGRLTGYDPRARRLAWAKRRTADVVYYPSHRDTLQHRHIRTVCTVHAILPEYTAREMEILERHLEHGAAVVTSWPHPFQELRSRYPWVEDKLFLVPYSALHSNPAPREQTLAKFGLTRPFYFYPSDVLVRKNHMNLVKAAAVLRRGGERDFLLVFTGGGDRSLQSKVERMITDFSLKDQVRFIGHVDSAEMSALYEGCRATVSGSLWEAGIAPLQEGLRFGKPCLCARIPPAIEHAKLLGFDVCLFDPNDPERIAETIIEFERDFGRYSRSASDAAPVAAAIDATYMGRCYADILRFAAGHQDKPPWFPFLDPMTLSRASASGVN